MCRPPISRNGRRRSPNTKLFFLETPSNPLTEVSDMAAIAAVAKSCGALLVVDNCFCTPILQRPLDLGADIVIHSATKYLDGQGRVLGGAVLGSKKMMEPVYQFPAHHRPHHERLQCLDIPERHGDAQDAHGRAQRQCAATGAVAGTAAECGARVSTPACRRIRNTSWR